MFLKQLVLFLLDPFVPFGFATSLVFGEQTKLFVRIALDVN